MRKLFQRVIAVVLCLSVLNDIDFSAFAQKEDFAEGLLTVSQDEVVVSDGDSVAGQEVEVKIHYYLGSEDAGAPASEIFIPQEYTSQTGAIIDDLNRAGYEVTEVSMDGEIVFADNGTGVSSGNSVEIKDVNNDGIVYVNVTYDGTVGTLENEVTIFDYTNGKASNNKSINYTGNYPSDVPYNQRMGTIGAVHDYVTLMEQKNGDGENAVTRTFNINSFERFEYTNGVRGSFDYKYRYPVLEGLLLGLSGDNYEKVNFRFADPGFFVNDGGVGKTVEEGYEFVFNRNGFAYDLVGVVNDERGSYWTELSNFFPLPELVSYSNGKYRSSKNEYFGIRYDFEFVLGDYIGDMTYSFSGDDDLWVCLDGEVILDIGGIHGKYPKVGGYGSATYAPGSADVWAELLGEGYSQNDKIQYLLDSTTDADGKTNATRAHRVTVLYMERGGNESNCNISFVMPYVVAAPPVVRTAATLSLNKVDADTKVALSGVGFSLSDGSTTYSGTTDENGMLSFSDLTAGTYTLTETAPKVGYKSDSSWTVVISESREGNTITPYISSISPELVKENGYYIIENKKCVADLTFTKVDADNQTPLENAAFQLVNKEGTADYNQTVTSDENGIVEFKELPLGEYTLTEIVAPNGYIKSVTSWDVEVSENGDIVIAKLFDGDNEIEQIENIPVESVMEYGKTATLLDNRDRTYTISLSAGLKELAQSIVLNDVQIVDYIDPRFEITEDSKEALRAVGATISVEDGMEVVTWDGVTLTSSPWNGELIVKAKNDFLGGDEVPTNGPESGLVVYGQVLKFPIPTVDVRLLDLNIEGGRIKVFIEDSIVPMTYWTNNVEGTLKSVYVNSKEQSFENAMVALSTEKREELFAEGSCTVPYSYAGEQFGNLVYNAKNRTFDVLDEHIATEVGESYEVYEFSVTYEAINRTAGSEGRLFGSETTECQCIVDVVAGRITIVKKINPEETNLSQGDPIFTFKIMKDGSTYAYKTVRFTSEIDYMKIVVLDKLPRGEYDVEELATMRYECVDVNVEATSSCPAIVSEDNVITIGYDADGSEDLTKRNAEVTVTNVKEKKLNFSDTDVVVNTCSFGENGILIWSGDYLTGSAN